MFYFVSGIDESPEKPDKSPLEQSIGDNSTNYLHIMNILQTRISSPEGDLNENDNGNELNEHRESAEVDDFLTFDISDDIVHYDINEIKNPLKLILKGDRKFLREVT